MPQGFQDVPAIKHVGIICASVACVCLLWYKLYHVQFMLHACVCAALKHVYLHYISCTLL